MTSPAPGKNRSPQLPDPALRPATADDAATLFQWVNSEGSLQWKLETIAPIPWSDHVAWLRAKLTDGQTTIDIIEIDGNPVGQIRGESKNKGPNPGRHIDIFIAAEYRKGGLAARALVRWLARYDERPVVALVNRDNVASQRLFRSAGFKQQEEYDDVLAYIKA